MLNSTTAYIYNLASEDNYKLPQSLIPVSEEKKKSILCHIEKRMNQLETSLRKLAQNSPFLSTAVTNHQIISISDPVVIKWRYAVAREIYLYQRIIKMYSHYIQEWPGTMSNDAEILIKHQKHLEKIVTEVALLHSPNKNHFNTIETCSQKLIDTNTVNKVNENPTPVISQNVQRVPVKKLDKSLQWNPSTTDGKKKMQSALRELKVDMSSEVYKMRAAAEQLEISSKKLHTAESSFSLLGSHLQVATKSLKNIKRITEQDSKYIWIAFLFFLSTASFILLKRIKFLRILIWVMIFVCKRVVEFSYYLHSSNLTLFVSKLKTMQSRHPNNSVKTILSSAMSNYQTYYFMRPFIILSNKCFLYDVLPDS